MVSHSGVSLTTNEIVHLFIVLFLAICFLFCACRGLLPVSVRFFILLICWNSLYSGEFFVDYVYYKHLLPVCSLSFHFLMMTFDEKVFQWCWVCFPSTLCACVRPYCSTPRDSFSCGFACSFLGLYSIHSWLWTVGFKERVCIHQDRPDYAVV